MDDGWNSGSFGWEESGGCGEFLRICSLRLALSCRPSPLLSRTRADLLLLSLSFFFFFRELSITSSKELLLSASRYVFPLARRPSRLVSR